MVVVVVLWLAFAGFGCWIASVKHRPPEEGFFVGLLFGPLGCLIEALLPTLEPKARPSNDDDDDPLDLVWTNPHDHAAEVKNRRQAEVERHDAFEAQILEDQRAYARVRRDRRDVRREWVARMIWRFGWFHALPEAIQPIVVGLAIALPIVVAIALAMRS